jgi:hypothetical protein
VIRGGREERGVGSNWLVDAENPLLTAAAMARVDDEGRPDRLAWNAFRTLALWDTDVWVPRLLQIACGDASPLPALEWAGGSVLPWATGLPLEHTADVVLDGPEAVVVAGATFRTDLSLAELRAGVGPAMGDTLQGGRQTGLMVVVPPDAADHAAAVDTGWLTWRDLGVLALDLAEESDELRSEQVHRLVGDLQDRFPDVEL